jgi:hypothetical protein
VIALRIRFRGFDDANVDAVHALRAAAILGRPWVAPPPAPPPATPPAPRLAGESSPASTALAKPSALGGTQPIALTRALVEVLEEAAAGKAAVRAGSGAGALAPAAAAAARDAALRARAALALASGSLVDFLALIDRLFAAAEGANSGGSGGGSPNLAPLSRETAALLARVVARLRDPRLVDAVGVRAIAAAAAAEAAITRAMECAGALGTARRRGARGGAAVAPPRALAPAPLPGPPLVAGARVGPAVLGP